MSELLTNPMHLADLGAAWLLTYALHSTLLLGGVWLAIRLPARLRQGSLPTLATQETLWRAALLGGLITATLQLGLGWQPPLGAWQLDTGTAVGVTASVSPALLSEPAPEAATPDPFDVSPRRTARTPASGAEGSPTSSAGPSAPAAGSGLPVPGADPANPPLGALFPAASSAASSSALRPLLRWSLLITALWLLGALALTAALTLSYRAFSRRIRNRSRLVGGDVRRLFDELEPARAVGRPVELTASSRVQSPLAKGVTRPEICLPVRALSELSGRQQRTLLAHELGHLVRRDPAWLLIARGLESVFFFQPLNRLARRRLQEISELRADDWAVTATGNALDLARCLTRVADWNLTPVPVPSMAERTGAGLTRRVHRLLQAREVEGERGRRGLWLAAGAVLLAVALAAPGVSAVGGGSEAPEPPEAPEAPPAPQTVEAPEAPEAPQAPEAPGIAEAPEAPPAPGEMPSLWAPRPPAPPSPGSVEAPSPPGPAPSPAPVARATPSREGPALAHPVLSRPPRIAPIPRVALSPATASEPPSPYPLRLARMASPGPAPAPAPAPSPGEPGGGEPGETYSPREHRRWDELSREELEALEEELAEVLEEALEPLEAMDEETAELIEMELEAELEAMELELATVDETLEIELEALAALEDDDLVDLSNAEIAELNAHIQAMNAAILAELEPLLEVDLDLRLPQVEHLAEASALRARHLAEEAHRMARDGVSEEEAARLRDEARRLAEEMRPQREEIERLQAEARRLAREAREQVGDQTRELRQRLRDQQRQQLEELRRKLETLRDEREEERERRREELRSRLETQRRQLEEQRRELRSRIDQEREERRLQMEEHRKELERQRELQRERMLERQREIERRRELEGESENDEEG